MRQIIVFTVVNFILCLSCKLTAQILWEENFPVPEKGYWADDSAKLQLDTTGVVWGVDIGGCYFAAVNDYAKSVSTSGGRFEVLDSDGDALWYSPAFDISYYDAVNVSFRAGESGSSNSTEKKYIKAYFMVNGELTPFSPDSTAFGNWDEKTFSAEGISGKSLRLFIKMNSSYSNDKVFIDDIKIVTIDSSKLKPQGIRTISSPAISFIDEKIVVTAVCYNGYNIMVNDSSINLNFSGDNFEVVNYFQGNGVYFWVVKCLGYGDLKYIISSDSTNVMNPFTGYISVFKESDLLFKENYEVLPEGEKKGEQWTVSITEPIEGEKSIKHIEQAEPGEGVLKIGGNDTIDLTEAEYLLSFKIKNGDWNPTSTNTFYLILSGDDDTSTDRSKINGYVIGVNAKGSSDSVSFWRLKNGKIDKEIIQTKFKWKENTSAQIILKRLSTGEWILSVIDLNTGTTATSSGFNIEITKVFDIELKFKYSQSRSGLLWFDDLLIIRENLPPEIKEVKILKGGVLQLDFSEPIMTDRLDSSTFKISDENGKVFNVVNMKIESQRRVLLEIEEKGRANLTVSAYGVYDLEGEKKDTASFKFIFQLPVVKYDIVFTEIMCDPEPVVNLPNAEFIEIYNTSDKLIDSYGWKLDVKGTDYSLADNQILPREYIILCHPADSILFAEYGKVITVSRFPSLLNSESNIGLISSEEEIIDKINYSDDWYGANYKSKGGYTIEKEDPCRNCGYSQNWIASVDYKGGTPGQINSVNKNNTDSIAPSIVSVILISDSEVDLQLNELLDTTFIKDVSGYKIDGLSIDSISYEEKSAKIRLVFREQIQDNIKYFIMIDNLVDECGNSANDYICEFSKVTFNYGDILINEALFNPYSGGSDFIELFNNTGKDIDISRLNLASRNDSLGLKNICSLSSVPLMITKDAYLAFTKDLEGVSSFYSIPYPDNLIVMDDFPIFNDDEGIIVLVDDSLKVIDEFEYNEDLHELWISDRNGVSLERSSVNISTNETGNWHSASSIVGYATPGYENSEKETHDEQELSVTLEPDAISPNDDGYNDEMIITINTDEPGYLLNVFVYDLNGREVRRLSNNDLLGNSGNISFNGCDSNGRTLPSGMYIILCEMLHRDGKRKVLKRVVLICG